MCVSVVCWCVYCLCDFVVGVCCVGFDWLWIVDVLVVVDFCCVCDWLYVVENLCVVLCYCLLVKYCG